MRRAAFLTIVVAVYIFLLTPLVYVVASSFSGDPLAFPPRDITLQWYRGLSQEYLESLKVSLIVGLSVAGLTTVLGAGIGIAVGRSRNAAGRFVGFLAIVPLLVPTLVIGVALFQFSLLAYDWSGLQLGGTMIGLILAHTSFTTPFVVRAVMAAHSLFDQRVEEAAMSLGAKPLKVLRYVTLPVLAPSIVSGAIFAFLASFDDLPVALFVGGGDATTFPLQIFSEISYGLSPEVLAASSLVILACVVLLILVDCLVGLERFFGVGRS